MSVRAKANALIAGAVVAVVAGSFALFPAPHHSARPHHAHWRVPAGWVKVNEIQGNVVYDTPCAHMLVFDVTRTVPGTAAARAGAAAEVLSQEMTGLPAGELNGVTGDDDTWVVAPRSNIGVAVHRYHGNTADTLAFIPAPKPGCTPAQVAPTVAQEVDALRKWGH